MEPIPPQPRRNWTVPIIAVVIGLVVVLILCLAGTAAAIFAWRANIAEPAPASPSAQPSNSPPAPTKAPVSPAGCLLGDWAETSYSGYANVYGNRVQLSGKGTLMRYTATEVLLVLENVSITGTSDGDTYEVIHNGSLLLNYSATDTELHYSNPRASGTTTWKVNGSVEDTEPLKASLKSE